MKLSDWFLALLDQGPIAAVEVPIPPVVSLAPAVPHQEAMEPFPMSDLSVTVHAFEGWISGKTDFNAFKNTEIALYTGEVAKLAPSVQPGVQAMVSSFASNASALGSIAIAAAQPILSETSDQQATQVLSILQSLGVPATGPSNPLEHAALAAVITGLKASLDRIGIHIATGLSPAVAAPPAPPVVQ